MENVVYDRYMKVLAIETSCDETAICIAESNGNKEDLIKVKILGNSLISQVNEHAKYGGVYPTLAVREHKKNLCPVLFDVLQSAGKLGSLITIKEDILNDVKVIADKVVLSSAVYGSFITLNDSTYVEKDSFIEEDFVFIGKDLVFSGETQGNLVFIGNNITVTDTAKIGGKLTIKGKNKKISKGAYIGETTAFDEEIKKHKYGQDKSTENALIVFVKILSLIAFGLLVGFVFNNKDRWSLFGVLRNHPARSVGFGVLSLALLVPVIVLLSIVNWFVGVTVLFAFLGLFAMSFVYLVVTVADIMHMIIKRDFNFSIYTAFALLFILFLLKVHLIFASLLFLVWVFVFGASVIRLYSGILRRQEQ